MIAGGGIFGLVAIALWIYCIFDCIRTDESVVQNLPKTIWLLIVIFVPTIGSIAWLLLGRPTGASFQLGSTAYRAPPPPEPTGFAEPKITDTEDYERRREEMLRRYEAEREERLKEREEQLQRWEEELRRREEGTEEPG